MFEGLKEILKIWWDRFTAYRETSIHICKYQDHYTIKVMDWRCYGFIAVTRKRHYYENSALIPAYLANEAREDANAWIERKD